MKKNLFLACMAILLVGCSTEDEHYYRTHPQVLQDKLNACAYKSPGKLSCEKLSEIALNINAIAYQLQSNPQAFGRKILALQEKLANEQLNLKTHPDEVELKAKIKKSKQQLAECLAVIRWLESPES